MVNASPRNLALIGAAGFVAHPSTFVMADVHIGARWILGQNGGAVSRVDRDQR